MKTVDPFGRTDRLDAATLEGLVVRFEARGKHPRFTQMLHQYLDAMQIDARALVLDVGCGTGLAARAIARRPAFSGKVVGVDLSPHLIEAAARLARDEGLAERTQFQTADVHHLDFNDQTFDAVVAHTLLSHADDPLDVLKQMSRVLKPGGLVAIFDGDYASLTFEHADPAQARRYDEALISSLVTNPRVMRQMPRLLRTAGLELVTSFAHVIAEAGAANFWSTAIEAYRALMLKAGGLGEAEANAWAAGLRQDSSEGVFFGACNYYAYVARRP